ncbi:hypothetical protein [Nostoc sp. 'Lobaria pulmonaria (5183) cyanobiont']|uniref:hypothetical protein n=1 Tax=Nostoc sp. 'Lobaria pulmonaria (5183) cyanobiont' TaxID=1618022 RepID=UPI000CF31101|nr:hypothetical protein [Nostoc sp. 'Lobaria pulmonaria (5183) cyanobiont']
MQAPKIEQAQAEAQENPPAAATTAAATLTVGYPSTANPLLDIDLSAAARFATPRSGAAVVGHPLCMTVEPEPETLDIVAAATLAAAALAAAATLAAAVASAARLAHTTAADATAAADRSAAAVVLLFVLFLFLFVLFLTVADVRYYPQSLPLLVFSVL